MLGWGIENKLLMLLEPDFAEHRGDNVLLIWRDVPHWMVIDEEMKAFLYAFQQPHRLSELFCNQSHFKRHRWRLKRLVKQLAQKGILHHPDNPPTVQTEVSTEPLPIENIAWNLTHRCNLRCQYCYYFDSLGQTGDELTAAEVITFIKRLKPFLSKRPTLTVLGGEPLLDWQKLIDVCAFAKQEKINPLVSTNGTLVTDDFAKEAKRIGLEVQVSLDGPDAATNDPLRGDGTFEKIRKGVETLKRHGVYTILSMVCTRSNFASLRDFLDLALQWHADEARFIPLKNMGGAKASNLQMVPYAEIIAAAYRLLKDNPRYRDLLGRDCLSILANTCRYSAPRSSCGIGSQTLLLDADGTLYPCLNLNREEFAFGNIRENSFDFEKNWKNHENLGNVRTCASVYNIERGCFDCCLKHWCLGGCRGETLANTGDLAAPSIHCGDLKKTIIEIFWILSEKPGIIKSYDKLG